MLVYFWLSILILIGVVFAGKILLAPSLDLPIIHSNNLLEIFSGTFPFIFIRTRAIVQTIYDQIIKFPNRVGKMTFRFYGDIVVIGSPNVALDLLKLDLPKKGFTYKVLSKFTGGSGDFISVLDHRSNAFYIRNRQKCFDALYHFFLNRYDMIKNHIQLLLNDIVYRGSEEIDCKELFHSIMAKLLSKLLFDFSDTKIVDELRNHFEWLVDDVSIRPYAYLIPLYHYLPLPRNLEYHRRQNEINKHIKYILTYGTKEDTIIHLLSNNGNSMEEIISCLKLLFFAGHETTATALSWAFYFIARDPVLKANLESDIEDINPIPELNEIYQLTSIRACIMESLRLKPIVNTTSRECPVSCMKNSLDSTRSFLKNSLDSKNLPDTTPDLLEPTVECMFFTKAIHLDPDYWPEPEKFDHHRYLDGSDLTYWIPFQIGKRQCMGKEFALDEITIILASMIKKFDFQIVGEVHVKEITKLTLEPSQLVVKFTPKEVLKVQKNTPEIGLKVQKNIPEIVLKVQKNIPEIGLKVQKNTPEIVLKVQKNTPEIVLKVQKNTPEIGLKVQKNTPEIGLKVQKNTPLEMDSDQIIVTYKGNLYNITKFIPFHPGGPAILKLKNGMDITEIMDSSSHGSGAYKRLEKYLVKD